MDGKQRERAAKLDRRAMARLHAEIIDCADDPHKMSHHLMIEDLRNFGVEVTFKQIENALRTLGYKWKEVFLPASNSDRGKRPRQPEADERSAFKELDETTDVHWSTAGPDISALLDRIERLEQTLTTSGLAEYRGLLQQAQTEAGLAKERAAAIRVDMRTLLNRVEEVYSQQQALLRLVSSIRLHQDRQQSEQAQPSQEPQP